MADIAFEKTAGLIRFFTRELQALPERIQKTAFDIRLQTGQPVSIRTGTGVFYLKGQGNLTKNWQEASLQCTAGQMQELFMQLCAHSIFSHENEIRNGFVMVEGMYRVGISGTAVAEEGRIKNIRDISSLVFRIPREKKGCSAPLFHGNVDFSRGVLLVGQPSSGKTTLLRDIVQSLSFGTYCASKRVAVVDERDEISGCYNMGPCADILRGYPKSAGIELATRTLSPEVLVCDELSHTELESVTKTLYSGVPLVASVHGSIQNLLHMQAIRTMLEQQIFETVVFLTGRNAPGQLKTIYRAGELFEAVGCGADYDKQSGNGAAPGTETEKKRVHAA